MTSIARAALLALLIGAGATAISAGTSPAQTGLLSVTLGNDGPLAPGATVTATVTGGRTGDDAFVQQCAPGTSACNPAFVGEFDVDGSVDVELAVRRLIAGPDGLVDCATAACHLTVRVQQTGDTASVPIVIDESIPVVRPVLTVGGTSALPDRAMVALRGRGFEPSTPVALYECAWTDTVRCFENTIGFAFTDDNGRFATEVPVARVVAGTDCAVRRCQIWAFPFGNFDHTTARGLVFDGADAPTDPSIEVTPVTGLLHRQTVDVSGDDFMPDMYVPLRQCANAEPDRTCRHVGEAMVGSDGSFASTITLLRSVGGVDCAAVACVVETRSPPADLIEVAVEFDGSVPPPPLPSATVEPATDLVDGQVVAVEIRDVEPGSFAYIRVCATDGSACRGQASSAIEGAVTTIPTAVRRILAPAADCAVVACALRVEIYGTDTYTFVLPLAFDPDAPPGPGPGIRVVPATGIWDRQRVELRGEAFDPGSFLAVMQCTGTDPTPTTCTPPSAYITPDAQGNFSQRFTVRRILDLPGDTRDCATDACHLVVDGDTRAMVELGFDPDGPLVGSDLPPQGECVPWPTTSWPTGPLPAGVDAVAIDAVGEQMVGPQGGDSVVVIHGGRLVYENYADGVTADTVLPSFSMSKSFTSTMIGLLVDDGVLALDERAPVPEWSDPADDRNAISLRHLLNMSSGLQWFESYSQGSSDVIQMILSPDSAGYAIAKPLEYEPGSVFRYSTGDTMVLGRIIAAAAGVSGADYVSYLHDRLFDPLGIDPVDPGIDPAGTWTAGWKTDTTTRNFAKLGLLYLRNGVWESEQFLSSEWVDFVRTPSPPWSGYGGQFWLDGDGSFRMVGFAGQTVHIVPALDLIVAVNNGSSTHEMVALFENAERPSCGDSPTANDDTATAVADEAVDIDVLANDSGGPGDLAPSTLTIASAATSGSAEVVDGFVRYEPNPGFTGGDAFTYVICTADRQVCMEASVAIEVRP